MGDRESLEESAGLLVGHSISRVRILGWWDGAPEEPGAYVEFVEVTMDDGAVLRVSTDSDELGPYGISIYEGTYPPPAEAIQVLDATGCGDWPSLLGATIVESKIGWAEVEVARVYRPDSARHPPARPAVSVRMERVVIPCDLEIRFHGGGSVILAAAAWNSDGTLATECDNVAIVFGDADAQRLGVGRWRTGRVA
jgi:hypothetical protein